LISLKIRIWLSSTLLFTEHPLKIIDSTFNNRHIPSKINTGAIPIGTDYGKVEISLETKISQVLAQLKSGKAVIVFDPKSETCTILKSDDPALKSIERLGPG